LRIELRHFAERAEGLIAVEAVEQREPLIEELLRVGAPCRDGMVPNAGAFVEGDGFLLGERKRNE
jgi:hypothetical protein